jgi:hypothetical protein
MNDVTRGLRFGVLSTRDQLQSWETAAVQHLLATEGVLEAAEFRALGRAICAGGSSTSLLARLRELRLDFILSFVPAAVSRRFTDAAALGVWQFFFGDWMRYRGESNGFWEIHDDTGVAVVYLAQLQPDGDTVRFLREGAIRAEAFSVRRTLQNLGSSAAHWPAQICRELLSGDNGSLETPLARSASQPLRAVNLAAKLRCILRGAWREIRIRGRTHLRHQHWRIGLVDVPIQSLLKGGPLPEARWLTRLKRNEFHADPFGIEVDGRLTILCEYLHYRDARGIIVALAPDDERCARTVEIGPKPAVHLSYPYLLQEDGRVYCIPETGDADEVALYECERFPDRWKRAATLMTNTRLVDATPIWHEGRWWIFAAVPAPKGADCELHLWFANKLLGEWQPHPSNPVKTDVRSARPAGTPFIENGVLYRPAQDSSWEYGQRVAINRIVTMTPTAFREVPHATIEPDKNGACPDGLHTLTAIGQRTLIDARCDMFSPHELWRMIRSRWQRSAALPPEQPLKELEPGELRPPAF